jgi:hypothetical protein
VPFLEQSLRVSTSDSSERAERIAGSAAAGQWMEVVVRWDGHSAVVDFEGLADRELMDDIEAMIRSMRWTEERVEG